jgi:hypothetical protein
MGRRSVLLCSSWNFYDLYAKKACGFSDEKLYAFFCLWGRCSQAAKQIFS